MEGPGPVQITDPGGPKTYGFELCFIYKVILLPSGPFCGSGRAWAGGGGWRGRTGLGQVPSLPGGSVHIMKEITRRGRVNGDVVIKHMNRKSGGILNF
jgi:hypothetical protein